MYFIRIAVFFSFLAILAACGTTGNKEPSERPTTVQASPDSITKTPENTKTRKPLFSPEPPPIRAKHDLSTEEKIALSYINDFLNSDDVKGKQKYVRKHVLASRQPLFLKAASTIAKEELRYRNAQVVESKQFKYMGKLVTLVLIQSPESNQCACDSSIKEVIILLENSKLTSGYLVSDSPNWGTAFNELRNIFKAEPHPKPLPVPEKRDLSADVEVALAYFNVFLNNDNKEERMNYLHDHIHPKMLDIYIRYALEPSDNVPRYKKPRVVESRVYPFADGNEGSLVLLKSSGQEIIAIMKQSKFVITYTQSKNMEEAVVFNELRKKFQTARPKQ